MAGVRLLSFDLDDRTGWPQEWLVLLKQYPRETWQAAESPVAQFWLERHDAFRRQCAALESITSQYRARRLTPQEFAVQTAPRLQNLLSQLHGHHQIEDFHYFPHFRTTEPRLEKGFDSLEKDHGTLQGSIEQVIRSFNTFAAAVGVDGDTRENVQCSVAEDFAEACCLLYRRLGRHLDDEEDLIIPLMLDRG